MPENIFKKTFIFYALLPKRIRNKAHWKRTSKDLKMADQPSFDTYINGLIKKEIDETFWKQLPQDIYNEESNSFSSFWFLPI